MSAFSARGSLFMSSWDPIGPGGFADIYSSIITKELSDQEAEAHPVTGVNMPLRAAWTGVSSNIEIAADGRAIGKIPVPADAVLWNAQDQKWESGLTYSDLKGDGSTFGYTKTDAITAFSKGTFSFKFGSWHHGRPVSINDYRYALALPYDVSFNKGPNDRVYEAEYAGTVNPNLIRSRGIVFNKDSSITSYGDVNYPMDQNQLAGMLCPSLMVAGANYGAIVPWEILEAVKGIVSEGSASHTAWSYNSNADFTEVDLLSQKCVADLKAKLREFIDAERVPAALRGFVTPAEAAKEYSLALTFIDRHGHAYISNGGFILESFDPANNTGVLVANRDPSYPYAKGYFVTALAASFARIDAIKVPTYRKGAGLAVGVTVSQVAFPANTSRPAARANVKVTLVGDAQATFPAALVKPGSFEAVIPQKALSGLRPGSYTLIVEASLGADAGAVDTANLIIF
jgi:peptide/nickel transport system substrate-binding protein